MKKPPLVEPYTKTYERGNGRHKSSRRTHIVIAERVLGKALPKGAEIHHVDGNGKNNVHNNLVVCQDDRYHKFLHRRTNGLRNFGNIRARKCWLCQRYDMPERLSIHAVKTGDVVEHITCRNDYRRRRYAEKAAAL